MHRDEAVVGLGRDQRVVRLRQLEAHDQRLDAAEDEEQEGGEEVEDPDLLVIGGGEPREPALGRSGRPVHDDLGARAAARRFHYSALPLARALALLGRAPRRPPRCRPRCRMAQLSNCVGRDRAHRGAHVRVVVAAELGALAAVTSAGLAGILNQVSFTWPGTPSTLPPSLGIHQEWITSEARDVERHRGVGGHHHLVVAVERLVARVVVAPEVLVAVDLDVQRRAAARRRLGLVDRGEQRLRGEAVGTGWRRVLDVVEVHEGDHGEHHEDQRRAERPAQLERRVPADLSGLGPAAARAVAHQRPDQRALHDQEDHDRHVERDLVERVDVVGVRRSARFGREGVGQGAGRGDQEGDEAAARAASSTRRVRRRGKARRIISLVRTSAPLRAVAPR